MRDGTAFAGLRWMRGLALPALAAFCTLPAAAQASHVTNQANNNRSVITLRSGAIPTHDGLQLTLNADTGNVRIFTDATGEVRYQVRVETGASDPNAAALLKEFSLRARGTASGVALDGRMPAFGKVEADLGSARVSYEVHVPRRYNLAVGTQAGDIVTQNIDGRVALTTGGGNIQAGRVGGSSGRDARDPYSARLETGGGHILVGDVSGGLRASTGGGHITAGNVRGDALLHTEGGHIQVGRVLGSSQLTTGGGNIVAASAGDGVVAETAGGRIEFGEAAGSIHARTGGGGIRIAKVVGPTQLNSSDGGISLAGVDAPLHASTSAGAITAWFSPQYKMQQTGSAPAVSSELASGQGDIVVYLPRDIALTIDALVERGSDHRIFADPSFPLKVRSEDSATGHALRGQAVLNGGGVGGGVLHLRTGAGDIQLRFLDADTERQLASQQSAMVEQGLVARDAMLLAMERQTAAAFEDDVAGALLTQGAEVPANVAPQPAASNGLAEVERLFEGLWWGGLRVDPDEQQKRLVQAVRPEYPEAARQAGLEGDVTMRMEIGPDGVVKDVRTLSGDPELARAAVNAVAQWRYAPALLERRPVSVVTTVTLAFRLR